MGEKDCKEAVILQGILTAGEWDEATGHRSFILWTYDEQEYLVHFGKRNPNSTLASLLPAKVEIRGCPGMDYKGRKTVTAKEHKLINTEETK